MSNKSGTKFNNKSEFISNYCNEATKQDAYIHSAFYSGKLQKRLGVSSAKYSSNSVYYIGNDYEYLDFTQIRKPLPLKKRKI